MKDEYICYQITFNRCNLCTYLMLNYKKKRAAPNIAEFCFKKWRELYAKNTKDDCLVLTWTIVVVGASLFAKPLDALLRSAPVFAPERWI